MVSVVPDYGRFSLNELDEIDVSRVVRKTQRLMKSAGVVLALGATDFSINVDAVSADPYLQVQFTLFTPSKVGLLNRNLRRALNKTATIKRPLKVQEFDGDNAGIAYAIKYEFVLRKTYFQMQVNRADGRRCRNTRNRILHGERVALILFLHRIGLHNRLALLGARRINQKGGSNMILLE